MKKIVIFILLNLLLVSCTVQHYSPGKWESNPEPAIVFDDGSRMLLPNGGSGDGADGGE